MIATAIFALSVSFEAGREGAVSGVYADGWEILIRHAGHYMTHPSGFGYASFHDAS